MRIVLTILLLLWQLPQLIIGGLVHVYLLPFLTSTTAYSGSLFTTVPGLRGGFALGPFVFLPYFKDDLFKHEYGHCVQSRLLGPLYLLVIAIPSLVWWLWWNEKRGVSYYSFYTEKTADQLGGVQR